MTFRRSSRQVCLGAATLALGSLLACNAQPSGNGRGRPIEFSVPRRDGVTTNWQQLMSKPDGLKQLENDSYRPLQPLAPQSSLDGVVVLPTRPAATTAIQNKRVKEMLERRKDGTFTGPEDLFGASTVEGILKGPARAPDGKEQKDEPLLERYYERLATKEAMANNPGRSRNDELFGPASRSNPREEPAAQEDSDLPSNLKESTETLKKLLGSGDRDNPFVPAATHGNLSDIFGLGDNTLSKEQILDHKKYMDEYHSVLDSTWHPPAVTVPGNPLDFFAGVSASAAKPAIGLPSVSTPAVNRGLEAQSEALNPMLGPPGLSDVNAQALGQPKATSVQPKIEPTRVTPIAPSFDAPRRTFR